MIDLLLKHSGDPAADFELLQDIAAHEGVVRASGRGGDRSGVIAAEAAVRSDPGQAITFDSGGAAILRAAGRTWSAGRFESATIRTLRERAATAARAVVNNGGGRVRLFVLEGTTPATDIGSLQANGDSDTLFQVASQFNCLESPGPYVSAIERYFSDPTQGPRASISAFPGTFVRQYAAPAAEGGGRRFVQTTDGEQIDLLADVCTAGVACVRNGYLLPAGIAAPEGFAAALKTHFESIRVGVHDGVETVLGYNWDGAVPGAGGPRIAQVFTSTIAGGVYGDASGEHFVAIARQLLRAAYLGTLLAAVTLGRRRVVLTLIGGGVFSNPIPLIWGAIQWALREIEPLTAAPGLDVVVNGRNLSSEIGSQAILEAVRARGGVMLACRSEGAAIYR